MLRLFERPSLLDLVARHYSRGDPVRKPPSYIKSYEGLFAPLRDQPVRLLEVGVQKGRSLLVWRDYFPKGRIVGLDKRDRPRMLSDDIVFVKGDQADSAALHQASAHGPYDIIIDDASHIGALSRATFLGLFPSLKPGGLYVVEDYGTSFRADWPDFVASTPNREKLESCCTGMVGFLKQLVDDLVSDHSERQPVARIIFEPSIAFIEKVGGA